MNSGARFKFWVLLNILLTAVSVCTTIQFVNYKQYTLATNGNWQSTKTSLDKGVMGAWAMLYSKVALYKNHLDINAWHGYQEMVYYKKINAQSISFKYSANNTPFCFIIDKTDSGLAGVYFHYLNDTTCCLFTANKQGKFINTCNFKLSGEFQDNSRWNCAELLRNGDSVSLSVNQEPVLRAEFPTNPFIRPGFKGTSKPMQIDDVLALDKNGVCLLFESFSPPLIFSLNAIFYCLFLLAPLVFLILYRDYLAVVTFSNLLICLAIAFSYWFYFNHSSANYPQGPDEVNWHGVKTGIESEPDACKRISAEYPVGSLAGQKKVVLFIGSSQTWGAGVSEADKTMPALVEINLNAFYPDSNFTVINCGISGLTSKNLFEHYQKEWIKYAPILTVINLSTNDHDTAVFRANLQNFIELNHANHIKTLLIAEPNDFISSQLIANHNIVSITASTNGIKCIPVQQYLDSCSNTGFLWWDKYHMTDYGYSLFARKVSPEVIKAIGQKGE